MSNFDFLKQTDKNLFAIASEAEKLYKDEYFDQCISQTRRFAENACRNILGKKANSTDSFDEMLATLKDKSTGTTREKEFIEDLYFLKKEGNSAVHSGVVKKDAIVALECLQRMFEAAINFALAKDNTNTKLIRLAFDEELLILGTKKKKTLQEKYLEEKAKTELFKKPQKETKKKFEIKTKEKPKKKSSTEFLKQKKSEAPKKSSKPTYKKVSKKAFKKGSKKHKKSRFPLFWKIITFMATAGVVAGYLLIK